MCSHNPGVLLTGPTEHLDCLTRRNIDRRPSKQGASRMLDKLMSHYDANKLCIANVGSIRPDCFGHRTARNLNIAC
jgi:hypothetical protein